MLTVEQVKEFKVGSIKSAPIEYFDEGQIFSGESEVVFENLDQQITIEVAFDHQMNLESVFVNDYRDHELPHGEGSLWLASTKSWRDGEVSALWSDNCWALVERAEKLLQLVAKG